MPNCGRTNPWHNHWTENQETHIYNLSLTNTLMNTHTHLNTMSFADLDRGCQMIIFEPLMTVLVSSVKFWGSWGSIENWLEFKIKPPQANLAGPNQWNTLYVFSLYSLPPTLSLSLSNTHSPCLSHKPIFLCKRKSCILFHTVFPDMEYGTNFLHHIRVNKSFVSSMKWISEKKKLKKNI